MTRDIVIFIIVEKWRVFGFVRIQILSKVTVSSIAPVLPVLTSEPVSRNWVLCTHGQYPYRAPVPYYSPVTYHPLQLDIVLDVYI